MSEIALQTRNLTKRFGALTAVDNLSLEVRAGEIFGFLGPNGAGKTTSILMMCGLLRPDAGEVLIGGIPLRDGDPALRQAQGAANRARVGVCPQENILWDKLTCLEQLEFIGEAYGVQRLEARKRGAVLLGALGLAHKAHETAGKLSGGMKRRLNLALALVHDPEIIILDEPEAGLDPQSRVLVRDYIRSLARVKTVILTTHNMDEAERLADQVAIIDHGRLLVCGTPEALKRSLGEGDVLEMEVGDGALPLAREVFDNVTMTNHTLTARGHDLIERLPFLLEKLRVANTSQSEIKLRTNTLEDVFLNLTGRRLRE
jgi:ABC-2 type transport system ATP-binding protein